MYPCLLMETSQMVQKTKLVGLEPFVAVWAPARQPQQADRQTPPPRLPSLASPRGAPGTPQGPSVQDSEEVTCSLSLLVSPGSALTLLANLESLQPFFLMPRMVPDTRQLPEGRSGQMGGPGSQQLKPLPPRAEKGTLVHGQESGVKRCWVSPVGLLWLSGFGKGHTRVCSWKRRNIL